MERKRFFQGVGERIGAINRFIERGRSLIKQAPSYAQHLRESPTPEDIIKVSVVPVALLEAIMFRELLINGSHPPTPLFWVEFGSAALASIPGFVAFLRLTQPESTT